MSSPQNVIQQFLQKLPDELLRHTLHAGAEGAYKVIEELWAKFKEGWDEAGLEAEQAPTDLSLDHPDLQRLLSTLAAPKNDCPPGKTIKASIYGLYYSPGDRLYHEIKAKRFFATEAEAEAAGYLKPGKRRRASPKHQRQQKSKQTRSHQNPKRVRSITKKNK